MPMTTFALTKEEKHEKKGQKILRKYTRKVQKKIKKKWRPKKDKISKRIIAIFTIGKDGEVSNIKLTQASDRAKDNELAKKAILDAAPFKKLPLEYLNGYEYVNVEFTFDYNVFHSKHKNVPRKIVSYKYYSLRETREYVQRELNRVAANWQPSFTDISDLTKINFKVNTKGEVYDIKVLRESGFAQHNQEALEAINKASPFAAISPEYFEEGQNYLEIEISFDYNLGAF